MKRRLPPFPALRAFEAAARLGSFKAAAEELCVTTSAISHQVRTLESYLHRAMFDRSPGAVRLTAQGRDYLGRVGPILDQLDASTRLVAGETCEGPLNLQMTEAFMRRWLVPRMHRFVARHPGMDLRMECWLPPVHFAGGHPDIIVCWGDDQVPGVDVKPLLGSTRIPLCSPAYLRDNPDLHAPRDLLRKTLLRDAVADGWQEWFGLFGLADACPAGGPVFAHCELSLGAAEAGLGVTLAYDAILAETLARGTLVAPFAAASPIRTIYAVACEESRAEDARIVAFRDWLFEEATGADLGVPVPLDAAQ